METIRLSSKGQFVIPKTIRDFHNWGPGTELVIIDTGTEVIIKQNKPFAATTFEAPEAHSVYRGKPLSLEEMDTAVAVEAGKHR
jgi:AbrB family looped-hinge helix DNA binding protein